MGPYQDSEAGTLTPWTNRMYTDTISSSLTFSNVAIIVVSHIEVIDVPQVAELVIVVPCTLYL
jgi:hypothetical protein